MCLQGRRISPDGALHATRCRDQAPPTWLSRTSSSRLAPKFQQPVVSIQDVWPAAGWP